MVTLRFDTSDLEVERVEVKIGDVAWEGVQVCLRSPNWV